MDLTFDDLRKYRSLIFDCDGVILDSNSIKSAGFRAALNDYPKESVNRLVDYHLENGGVSRYVKFNYFFHTILGRKNFTIELETALIKFQDFILLQLKTCRLIPGIRDLLAKIEGYGVLCFVISSANQVELHQILKAHSLDGYFQKIYGSPNSKSDNMKTLAKEFGIARGKTLFFGDSEIDFQVANKFGLECIFVYGHSNWQSGIHECRQRGWRHIRDFTRIF